MEIVITYDILKEISKYYNPLGDKHTFLVDDFLMWAKKGGDFYWIWDGAVELANGMINPKSIIKGLPFMDSQSEYRNLLIEAWLQFLNERYRLSIINEYNMVINLPF